VPGLRTDSGRRVTGDPYNVREGAPIADHECKHGNDIALTHADLARMMRDLPVKDQSYTKSGPVGTLAGRYIRWLRNEWGATKTTVRDYEAIIARMSLALADREVFEVSVDDLRAVIDLWADREPRTRQKVTSVVRAFWAWAEDEGTSRFRLRRGSSAHGHRRRLSVRCRRARVRRCCSPPRTRATGSDCSACWCWGCAATNSAACRSATSIRRSAGCARTARARRNASCRCAGRSSPSSA
jgi:hypothetical protein